MSFARSLLARLVALRDALQRPAYDVFALALRIVFGWRFFLTGRGKLAHLESTTEFFSSLNIPAPGAHAVGIGLLECVGGLLLVLGAGTRLVSALLASTMLVALATAHRTEIVEDGLDGLLAAAPFPYLLATAILIVVGPGRLALDAWLASRLSGTCKTATTTR
jgi:putative oxidoreductase